MPINYPTGNDKRIDIFIEAGGRVDLVYFPKGRAVVKTALQIIELSHLERENSDGSTLYIEGRNISCGQGRFEGGTIRINYDYLRKIKIFVEGGSTPASTEANVLLGTPPVLMAAYARFVPL